MRRIVPLLALLAAALHSPLEAKTKGPKMSHAQKQKVKKNRAKSRKAVLKARQHALQSRTK